MVTSGSPITAVAPATTMSHDSASSEPPPSANPCTAATVGWGRFSTPPNAARNASCSAPRLEVGVAHRVAFFQVGAYTERAVTCRRQHNRVDVAVRGDCRSDRNQLASQLGGDGVESFRSCQLDLLDRFANFEPDCCHTPTLSVVHRR